MVSFATLFFGLVFGVVDVEVRVPAATDRVELLLGGERVAELRRPFGSAVDLGEEPAPGELVAIAYYTGGRELGRASQRFNTPRANAQARLALEPGEANRSPVARLDWSCPTGDAPGSVEVTLDGRKIAAPDPARILVPASGAKRPRLLRAVVECGRDVRAVAEVVVDGNRAAVSSERTAVPVVLEAGAALPTADGLAGWFSKEGRALEVAAVAEGGFDVVFVCEPSAFDELKRIFAKRAAPDSSTSDEDLQFRFLLPSGYPADETDEPGSRRGGFAASKWFPRRWAVIGPTLSRGIKLDEAFTPGQRLADAVAMAGFAAAGRERRRAVVLLLGPAAEDVSELSPAAAARYLAALRVPLHAWSVGRARSPEAESWDARTKVATAPELEAALARLRVELRRQRIVRVEGSHLPQSVTLTPLAKGIQLAR